MNINEFNNDYLNETVDKLSKENKTYLFFVTLTLFYYMVFIHPLMSFFYLIGNYKTLTDNTFST